MGCSNCKSSGNRESEVGVRVVDYIRRDDTSLLEELLKMMAFGQKMSISECIDGSVVPVKEFVGNFLCFALWVGSHKSFKVLTEKLNASIAKMDSLFHKQNLSPLSIICEKGYLEILKLYLPHYLQSFSTHQPEQSLTISFSNSPLVAESIYPHSPAQLACCFGHISILNFLKDLPNPVPTLSLHHIDELTGENCALVSIRTGNFYLIKFLFESVNADFHIKNSRGEGALQILAVATKTSCSLQYLECVMYLVEIVKIDISYMYEETLLLLENNIIIKYIEEKLKKIGILASKREIEVIYRIRPQVGLNITREKSNVVGDTQEISAINPNSVASAFANSLNF